MVLPCGQIVDKSTIDKHRENEIKQGRLPNDPFTGKAYHSDLQPKLDASLKARIDAFVLEKNGLSLTEVRKRNRLVEPLEEPKCKTNRLVSPPAAASSPSSGSSVLADLLRGRKRIL